MIAEVSDTALWVAAFRALESERPDAVFKDELAGRLAGERGKQMMASTPDIEAMSFAMSVRTTAIDRLLETAFSLGIDSVINLGAGMDTRPYRMKLPANLLWVEVDLPAMIAGKEEQLKDVQPMCDLQRFGCDLSDDAERDKCFAMLGTLTQKSLILTEGVIAYLSNGQAEKLSRSIYRIPSFHFWIMDYSQGRMRRHRSAEDLKKIVVHAPFKFDVSKPIQFFERYRWKVNENIFILDESARIGRKFPGMFPWNLLLRIFPPLRKAANKTYGYVMFSK